MVMDAVSNQIPGANSLFKPVPMSKLQQNLSHFYQQTSSFVDKELKEMVDSERSDQAKSSRLIAESNSEDGRPRLNPMGLGQLIDIHV